MLVTATGSAPKQSQRCRCAFHEVVIVTSVLRSTLSCTLLEFRYLLSMIEREGSPSRSIMMDAVGWSARMLSPIFAKQLR